MTGSGASPEFITPAVDDRTFRGYGFRIRSEEHTSELQSRSDLVCRLLLEKKKKTSQMKIRNAAVKMSTADGRLETRLTVGVARLESRDGKGRAPQMKALKEEDSGDAPQA